MSCVIPAGGSQRGTSGAETRIDNAIVSTLEDPSPSRRIQNCRRYVQRGMSVTEYFGLLFAAVFTTLVLVLVIGCFRGGFC